MDPAVESLVASAWHAEDRAQNREVVLGSRGFSFQVYKWVKRTDEGV